MFASWPPDAPLQLRPRTKPGKLERPEAEAKARRYLGIGKRDKLKMIPAYLTDNDFPFLHPKNQAVWLAEVSNLPLSPPPKDRKPSAQEAKPVVLTRLLVALDADTGQLIEAFTPPRRAWWKQVKLLGKEHEDFLRQQGLRFERPDAAPARTILEALRGMLGDGAEAQVEVRYFVFSDDPSQRLPTVRNAAVGRRTAFGVFREGLSLKPSGFAVTGKIVGRSIVVIDAATCNLLFNQSYGDPAKREDKNSGADSRTDTREKDRVVHGVVKAVEKQSLLLEDGQRFLLDEKTEYLRETGLDAAPAKLTDLSKGMRVYIGSRERAKKPTARVVVIERIQPKEDAARTEADKLEGTWIIVSEDSFRKGEKWVVENGQIRGGEKDKVYTFFRLDPRKMPKEIDITTMAQPDGRPLTVRKGIYSLKGDEWKLCLPAIDDEKRPAAFPRDPGPGQVLVLKRAVADKEKDRVVWGKAIEGLQCRLRADKSVWKAGEDPTFRLTVRDQGKRDLQMHMAECGCEVQWDGHWFRWGGPVSIPGGTWPAGRRYDDFDVRISLCKQWGNNQSFKLKPGKHTVRVAFVTLDRKPVRAISNAVTIEIGAPERKPR